MKTDLRKEIRYPSNRQRYSSGVRWVIGCCIPLLALTVGIVRAQSSADLAQVDLAVIQQRAAADDTAAQVELADRIRSGVGLAKDYTQALRWYRKAADKGDARAQSDIGWLYENGFGVPGDYSEAMTWYRKAADQGFPAAEVNLGRLYANGLGASRDYYLALVWYLRAAKQGNTDGQVLVGNLYRDGLGGPKDIAAARFWYQKAIDQGDPDATKALASLAMQGKNIAVVAGGTGSVQGGLIGPAALPPPQPSPSQLEPVKPAPQENPNHNLHLQLPSADLHDQSQEAIQHSTGGGGIPGPNGPAGPGMQPGATILTPTEGVNFSSYVQRLLATLKRNWYVVMPQSAMLGDKGLVGATFQINHDGSVPSPDPLLERTSGKGLLDSAAIKAIHSSIPFEPLPSEFKGPYIRLRIVFLYNLPLDYAK
jgi:TPR repeat protein